MTGVGASDVRECGVLVVGGGPGGIMAAIAAAGGGADVVLLDEAAGSRDARRAVAAGVAVIGGAVAWGAFLPREVAAVVAGRSVAFQPARLVLAPRPCPLPGPPGLAPETGLARALGARHAVGATGRLETVTDTWGRTSVDGVFAVPGAVSAWLARAAGRLAGLAAAGRNDDAAFAAWQRAGWHEPALVPAMPLPAPDDAVVCECEGVTAGMVRAALRDGAQSFPGVKRATRAGMGRCQARLCGATLDALCGGPAAEARQLAPRAPVHPVTAGALMRPREAHVEPIAAPAYAAWSTVPAPMLPSPPLQGSPCACDDLVIGGGIVGLAAALYLARAGRDVLLADRAEPGIGASTANAGSLHVQLLPYDFEDGDPGPLGEALALGPASIALWRELAADAGESFGIRTEGGLVLAADAADLAWLGRKAAFERARGIDTQLIGPAELARCAPALARGYAGAAFCAAEGQIDPLRGTMAAVRLAREAGVRIVSGAEVRELEPDGAGWRVTTGAGVIRAGQVLNAAGAHAAVVAGLAGVALPVRAVVQQVIATAPAPPMLRHLVAQARLHLSLKQGDGGHLLVGGGWPGRLGADGATRLLRHSIEGSLWTAAQVLPPLGGIDVVRAWTGLTVHLDRGPAIGGTPGQAGLFHAVTANGYTLGPVAARLAADAMLGLGAPPRAFALSG